jgi:ketosteroid isomerase-like protein
VLVLCDVLGFSVPEAAEILDVSSTSVTSTLDHARTSMAGHPPMSTVPDSRREVELAENFAEAFAVGDVEGVVELLTDDAWLRMPPLPLQYQGHENVAEFLRTIAFRGGRRYRLVPTRANGQPAFGCYLREAQTAIARAHGLIVITVTNSGISGVTRFMDNSILITFGFPKTLPIL